jgi:Phosphotransferase enzyme family
MIADPSTPEHLTEVLRRAGVLGDARVSDVAVEKSGPTILSQITHLRLSYEGASDGAPLAIILKTEIPDRRGLRWYSGSQEVAFYTNVAPLMAQQLTPRCFEAEADPATKSWHMLLEDLTESHVIATRWPLPPSHHQCEAIVHALARFHAAWWDDKRLGDPIGSWPDTKDTEARMQRLADAYPDFANRLGDSLTSERRNLIEQFLAAAPRLSAARYDARQHITIVHGDAHVWNYLLPRNPADDVRIFDWDSWFIGLGASDLAYMMAMHWYPDRRRTVEAHLLDHYHAALLASGVTNYDRHALQDDYRLAVLFRIQTPIWQAAYDIPPVIWWNNMERILLAIDDLGCRDLLT